MGAAHACAVANAIAPAIKSRFIDALPRSPASHIATSAHLPTAVETGCRRSWREQRVGLPMS